MSAKSKYERPEPRLKDWRFVETILAQRLAGKSGRQVAKGMGMGESSVATLLRRVRWMASVELGSGVPIGTTEQKVAKDFLTAWDSVGKAPPNRQGYRPMTAEEGRASSDAIRKLMHRNGKG